VQAIWSGRCGVVARVAANLLRLPCFVHVAGGELAALPDIGYGGGLRLRTRLTEPWVLRGADAVSAASSPILSSLARIGVRAEPLPLGVDLDAWPACAPRRRSPGEPLRLIQIASLNRVKDQPTLLRALARVNAAGTVATLDVVGEDTLNGETQRLAARLGVESWIRFAGYLPQRVLRAHVEAAHVCVVSSLHEAGPLALLEAAVAGVPTVGTAVGHLVDWAPGAALAVPTGDHVALAHAIARVAGDEELRLALAHEAQARALAIDAKYTAARFCELYEKQARHA
jgi:glycosyltransferase involved in cell wall biosynthesis